MLNSSLLYHHQCFEEWWFKLQFPCRIYLRASVGPSLTPLPSFFCLLPNSKTSSTLLPLNSSPGPQAWPLQPLLLLLPLSLLFKPSVSSVSVKPIIVEAAMPTVHAVANIGIARTHRSLSALAKRYTASSRATPGGGAAGMLTPAPSSLVHSRSFNQLLYPNNKSTVRCRTLRH